MLEHFEEKTFEPPTAEAETSEKYEYAIKVPETMAEAADLIREENTRSEAMIKKAMIELDRLSKKTGIDFSVQRAKLEDRWQEKRLDQHLNFIELFNLMSFGASVDRAYGKLSGNSKELYRMFAKELPHGATDETQDALLEIVKTVDHFSQKIGELPKDLKKFFDKYYRPLREGAAILEERRRAEEKKHATSTPAEQMDPETLKKFLSHL